MFGSVLGVRLLDSVNPLILTSAVFLPRSHFPFHFLNFSRIYFGSSIHNQPFVLRLVSSIQGRIGAAAAFFCAGVFGLLPTFAWSFMRASSKASGRGGQPAM